MQVRSKFYDLLTHCIPATVILKVRFCHHHYLFPLFPLNFPLLSFTRSLLSHLPNISPASVYLLPLPRIPYHPSGKLLSPLPVPGILWIGWHRARLRVAAARVSLGLSPRLHAGQERARRGSHDATSWLRWCSRSAALGAAEDRRRTEQGIRQT